MTRDRHVLNRATPTHVSTTLAMPSKKRKQRELAKAARKGHSAAIGIFQTSVRWRFDLVLHKFVRNSRILSELHSLALINKGTQEYLLL